MIAHPPGPILEARHLQDHEEESTNAIRFRKHLDEREALQCCHLCGTPPISVWINRAVKTSPEVVVSVSPAVRCIDRVHHTEQICTEQTKQTSRSYITAARSGRRAERACRAIYVDCCSNRFHPRRLRRPLLQQYSSVNNLGRFRSTSPRSNESRHGVMVTTLRKPALG